MLQVPDWTNNELKSYVVTGPPGCGKTTWAYDTIPKPALFVTHLDALKSFNERYHKGIVFDDLSFKHMPREAQINIVDRERPRAIHIRYTIIALPARIPKIFTANSFPFTEDAALRRRITHIKIGEE